VRHACDILGFRASLAPGRLAIVDAGDGTRLTYAELDRRAERCAGLLAERGVVKGDRVGVLSLNRAAVVDLLFACGKLGAVLAPLNTRLSARELAGIAADAGLSLLFHDSENADLAACIHAPRAPLEGGSHLAADPPRASARVTHEDAWILCYTGGTTGRAKGAILTHGSVRWNAANTIAGWGLSADDVASVFTPLYHTGGLNVLMTPLVHIGGASVLVPAFDPDRAFDLNRDHAMTYVFMVPSMFRMMIGSPRWRNAELGTVRDFVTGGAPCPRDVFEAFAVRGRRFRMGYGLTEAGPNNFNVDPGIALERHGSVGRPLPFVEARIEDGGGRECEPGRIGELLLRGPHVFAGYFRRPGETREAFSGGWLRTGDLARRDGDGNHYIVGRLKEMFISGGENVYPSEVEEALISHPAVADAAVVGVADERWGEVGLAAVVPRPGARLLEEELVGHLRRRLARYKVPRRFLFVGELPRTGAGKVDRRAIAAMG
jgi:fatty-acyl-CoA synthase